MLTGIDVSHYDPDLDWARAHAEGAAFIVHKASEGGSTDPEYARRASAIRASGAVPGAYHFLRSVPSAASQVQHFLDVIGDPTGLLIQLDWEPSGSDLAPISMAQAWVAEWRRRTDNHPVLIYLPRWVWADHLGSPPGLSTLGPLWASRYLPDQALELADAARVPAAWWAGYGGWTRPAVLQYAGEAGRIAGTGTADLNLYDGTLADLRQLARIPTPPEDDMPFTCQTFQLPAGFAFDADQKLLDQKAALVLGTPLGGLTGLTAGWLSLSADFSEAAEDGDLVQSTIRVAVAGRTPQGHAAWNVLPLVELDSADARRVINLPPNCDKVSVGRMDTAAGAGVDTPIGVTLEMN